MINKFNISADESSILMAESKVYIRVMMPKSIIASSKNASILSRTGATWKVIGTCCGVIISILFILMNVSSYFDDLFPGF